MALLLFGILTAYIIQQRNAPVTDSPSGTPVTTEAAATQASTQATTTTSQYKDGTYSAQGDYTTPGSTEVIDVTLTVKGGVVTASTVSQRPVDHDSRAYQMEFANNYKTLVIGKSLADINLDVVAGSSLTSGGFNKAVGKIRTQASS